jgi:hypothetical protein
MPWMRVIWALQIVMAGIQELEQNERKQAREIALHFYRDHRLSPGDRERIVRLARKVGTGAAKGAAGKKFRRG